MKIFSWIAMFCLVFGIASATCGWRGPPTTRMRVIEEVHYDYPCGYDYSHGHGCYGCGPGCGRLYHRGPERYYDRYEEEVYGWSSPAMNHRDEWRHHDEWRMLGEAGVEHPRSRPVKTKPRGV